MGPSVQFGMLCKQPSTRPHVNRFRPVWQSRFLYASLLGMVVSCSQKEESTVQESRTNEASVVATSTDSTASFTTKDCYRQHFPLAFGVPQAVVPPEVKFYCAAPWNIESFEQVRAALKSAEFDVIAATVRAAPDTERALLEKILPLAINEADKGPIGMGAVWHAYHFLPMLDAVRRKSAAVNLQKDDLKKLEVAALKIDWNMPAVRPQTTQANPALANDAKLQEVVQFILANRPNKE